jgi:sec-independent protein translocase protein TatA
MKPWHIVVLLAVILLLFGAPKLPELARSIGKSLNILKEETQNLQGNGKDPESGDDAASDTGARDNK